MLVHRRIVLARERREHDGAACHRAADAVGAAARVSRPSSTTRWPLREAIGRESSKNAPSNAAAAPSKEEPMEVVVDLWQPRRRQPDAMAVRVGKQRGRVNLTRARYTWRLGQRRRRARLAGANFAGAEHLQETPWFGSEYFQLTP